MRVIVIADDLSGAAELGAVALELGLTAEVQTDFDPSSTADVCLIDTDSRWCAPESAVRRVSQIARKLVGLRTPYWVYKKVDSLLRGSVSAECRALARTLGKERVVLIAANPSRRRIVREGRYYVDGVPLDETLHARDPEHPRRTAVVRELLSNPGVRLPTQIDEGLASIPVLAPDVAELADFEHWTRDLDANTLPAGAVDYFRALLTVRNSLDSGHPSRSQSAASMDGRSAETRCYSKQRRGTLVVCGSAAAWRERVVAAERSGLSCAHAPVSLLAAARDDGAVEAWGRELSSILRQRGRLLIGLGEPTGSAPSAALVRRLARAARIASQIAKADQLWLEGGATAAAVVREFGWNRLKVVGAPGPGVAELRAVGGEAIAAPVVLVKPGSYAWPAALWSALVAESGGSSP